MKTTMKVAQLVKPGEPFQLDEIPIPQVRPGDVLVNVKACGVVPNMTAVSSGKHWYLLPPLPAVYGLDCAGLVADVGEGVTSFKAGDRVFINPLLTCGQCHYCKSGKELMCPSLTLRGYFGTGPESERLMKAYPFGGFSEYTTANADKLVRLPASVSFETAARLGYVGTSYHALKRAGITAGSSVLIHGITGTLGVGAALLALALGATRILGTGRKTDVMQRLEKLGKGRIKTFALGSGKLDEWVRSETDGLGADGMIECQGRAADIGTTHEAIASLKRGGTAVIVGAVEGKIAFEYVFWLATATNLTGSMWFSTAEGDAMMEMARAGTLDLSSIEHKTYPLAKVDEALAFAATSPGGFTNVVVTI